MDHYPKLNSNIKIMNTAEDKRENMASIDLIDK